MGAREHSDADVMVIGLRVPFSPCRDDPQLQVSQLTLTDRVPWYRKVLPAAGFEPDVALEWLDNPPTGIRLGEGDEYLSWRGAGFEGLVIIRPAGSEMFLFQISAMRID